MGRPRKNENGLLGRADGRDKIHITGWPMDL
jgi:hypothetical protein